MTSIEDVTKIVAQSEERMIQILHKEINTLREEVKNDRESSHVALAKTISNFGAEVIRASQKLEDFMSKKGAKVDDLIIWREVHKAETVNISEKVDDLKKSLKEFAETITASLNARRGIVDGEMNEIAKRINVLEINASQTGVKVGIYATLGSALASSVVIFIVMKVLNI